MRWSVTLVVACLMAVTGVRPIEPTIHDRHAAAIEATHGLTPNVTARRDSSHAPDGWLQPFTIVPVSEFAPPRRAVLLASSSHPSHSLAVRCVGCSARGPPLG